MVKNRAMTLPARKVGKLIDAYSKHDYVQRFFPDYVGVEFCTAEEIRNLQMVNNYISASLNDILQLPLENVDLLRQDLSTGAGIICVQRVINSIKEELTNLMDHITQRPPEPENIALNISLVQNIKNFFSASCEWVTATVTNLFSRFEFNNHNNQHNVHIPNIEQGDDHSFSWANSISNFGRLFDAISSFSAYLWPVRVSSEGAAGQSGDDVHLELVGGERQESE